MRASGNGGRLPRDSELPAVGQREVELNTTLCPQRIAGGLVVVDEDESGLAVAAHGPAERFRVVKA